MARPKEMGLGYFPMNTGIFHDRKVRRLLKTFGANGYLLYNFVLCAIYEDKGYYVKCDADFLFDLADVLNLSEDLVTEIIRFCVSIELFSKPIFDAENVLTSHGIQKRYAEVKSRSSFVFDERYVVNETETGIHVAITDINVTETTTKEKERKEKERKEKEREEKERKENKETNPIGLAKKGELSLSQAPDLLKSEEGTQSPNGVDTVDPPKVSDTVSDKREQAIRNREKREQAIRNREKRMTVFHQTLLPYMSRYGAEMVRAFFEYWTEPNKSGSQMRFELEKTWSVDRRLATWERNESKFGNKKSSHYGETRDILYVRSPT